jgi:glucosamine kinase
MVAGNVRLYLGVEGGGTRTGAVIAAADGTILGWGEAGPANFLSVSLQTALQSTRKAVMLARAEAGLSSRQRFCAAAICIAGAGLVKDSGAMTRLAQSIAADTAVAKSDTDAAWTAAFPYGGPGLVAIAGTGSVVVGEDATGRRCQVGGWGYLIGDEGSGYSIGRAALAAVVRAHDSIGKPTGLTPRVLSWLGIDTVDELRDVIYSKTGDRRLIASVARPAFDTAEAGDEVARGIIEAAADELALAVAAGADQISDDGSIAVATYGALFGRAALLSRFATSLAAQAPRLQIVRDSMPALGGAVLLAMEAAAVRRDRALTEQIRSTMPSASEASRQGGSAP